ncbi:glycosyltransferase [Mesorhizobium sp. M7A.F.Ca.US.010.02.1.1]|uniref:glycosyltransferase family 32 protein n=1 Tax=Mesorhizobium sp. M7A.F.Ca.US.010.02.1.1 TaxID=2496743 RepID=UPI0019D4CD59|nr:glycosyltransferase [Mesorhizobium sp. M7A.F.Ca.US.010.02.1.1]
MTDMNPYPLGFEEREDLRSAFIREITLQQLEVSTRAVEDRNVEAGSIPRRLVRYWHDPTNLPQDVRACLESWDRLADDGFEFHMFDDASAAAYIADTYGRREREAFARCSHPAMRCDYLRMCFVLAEGGLYVDADDVLLGDGWKQIFRDGKLKMQPLCYDITASGMMPNAEIWRSDLPTDGRIFYVNNDPIAAPADHPVLRRALFRATERLLSDDLCPEIQSTTGPGNLTAALAVHARELQLVGLPFDFELLRDWSLIAEMRWDLSYRADTRNWRNVYGC